MGILEFRPEQFGRYKDILRAESGLRIGEMAVQRGWITAEQRDTCLQEQASGEGPRRRFGEILVARELIRSEQRDELLHQQRKDEMTRFFKSPPPAPDAPQVEPERRMGKFLLVERLGEGGAGEVWKAFDSDLSRWVALKLLKHDSASMAERFLREARMVARLSHQNIVTVYEVGELEGQPFIAMEYVEGRPIAQSWLPVREALQVIEEVAVAIDAAHQQGIIHRDLKPQNILLDAKGRPRVVDFGLAREVLPATEVTPVGIVIGTPQYMAPEQVRADPEGVDARTDVYGLGVTLFELLTGRPPFSGGNTFEVMEAVLKQEPRFLPNDRQVHRDIQTICLKSMEKQKALRYTTAAELGEDLRRFREGEPIRARPAGPAAWVWKRVRKSPGMYGAAAVAVVIAAGALIAQVVASRQIGLRDWGLKLSFAQRELYEDTHDLMLQAEEIGFRRQSPESEEALALIEQLEEKIGETERRIPQAGLPKAWRALYLFHLRKDEEGMREVERAIAASTADRPDPYGRLIRAWHLMKRYYRGFRANLGAGETRAMRGWLQLALEDLDVVSQMPVWNEMKEGRQYRVLAHALKALAEKRWALARDELSGLFGDRDLGPEARYLTGLAAYQSGDVEGAIQLWDEALKVKPSWLVLRLWKIIGRAELARARAERGEDATDDWELLTEECTELLSIAPGHADVFLGRGNAYVNRAKVLMNEGGKDPTQMLQSAHKDYTSMINLNQSDGRAYVSRGIVLRHLGDWEWRQKKDPTSLYEESLNDLNEGFRLLRTPARALKARADLGASLARAERNNAIRMIYFQHALEDYSRATRLTPGLASAHYGQARVLEALGDFRGAVSACEKAVAGAPRIVEFKRLLERLEAKAAELENGKEQNP